jgi:hypothetical protein
MYLQQLLCNVLKHKMVPIQRFVKTFMASMLSELFMRNEHQLQRLDPELLSGANIRVNCVRKEVPLE